jgi:hypothetical protein
VKLICSVLSSNLLKGLRRHDNNYEQDKEDDGEANEAGYPLEKDTEKRAAVVWHVVGMPITRWRASPMAVVTLAVNRPNDQQPKPIFL